MNALSPGSLSVGVRSATQSIMASMVSVGKAMVSSSSHTFTNNITRHDAPALKSRIHDYDIDSPLRLLKATSHRIDEPANSSIPLYMTGRI